MPKVSIYLPDDLCRRARERGLRLSALAQPAVLQELGRNANADWLEQVAERPPRVTAEIDTAALLDGVRQDFGA